MIDKPQIYRYKHDKRSVIITTLYFIATAIAAVGIYHLYAGNYFSAWFISVVCAMIALIALSIPHKLILSNESLTILCLLKVVDIPINEIVSVQRVEASERRWIVPLIGSFGFFGYFGYYLDLATFERVKIYATQWNDLIEIVDIYDDRHYISCTEGDELIATIEQQILSYEISKAMIEL